MGWMGWAGIIWTRLYEWIDSDYVYKQLFMAREFYELTDYNISTNARYEVVVDLRIRRELRP